jgi:hypothetical protein
MLGAALSALTLALAAFGVVSAGVFAYGTQGLPARTRWPTTFGVAVFPVAYLFLVLSAWSGPYNALCERRGVPMLGTANVAPLNEHANLAREGDDGWSVVFVGEDAASPLHNVRGVGATATHVYGTKLRDSSGPDTEWFLADARAEAPRTFADEADWSAAARAAGVTSLAIDAPAVAYDALRRAWIDYLFLAFEAVVLVALLVGWTRHVARVWARRGVPAR